MLETENLIPGLSIDCVIFGFHENTLKVLLLKLKNMELWALPGGFVEKDKDVDSEATRVLKQRTGLENIFLKQFHLFGNVNRNQERHFENLLKHEVIQRESLPWFEQRFVTVGYYALVEFSRVKAPIPDFTSSECIWHGFHDLPDLMLDHKGIICNAHQILKRDLNYHPIGINLLPEKFTMPELQSLYETVLEKKLDRRNFRRKMLAYDILDQTDERRIGGAHKAPMLYKFNSKKYHTALEEGLKSGW